MHSAGGGSSGRVTTSSRPTGRSRAAWRCIRAASATTSSCGSTRATWTPATAGRSPRATSCASASAPSTRTTPSSSRRCGWWRTSTPSPDGYQGNWIPHRIRPATEDGIFFAGDSAGHCLPLTAEGIRTAFYFGIALGRELRAVVDGRQDRAAALERYHAFSGAHRWKYESIYLAQQSIRHLHGRPLDTLTRVFARRKVSRWAFQHYLEIAPPQYAVPAPPTRAPVISRAAA